MAKRKDEIDIEGLKSTLIELKNQLSDVESDVMHKIKSKAIDAEQKMESKIERNPKSSVGIAFGAGLLTGVAAYALLKKNR